MSFEEWFENNKERFFQTTIVTICRLTWSAAWQAAMEKHWMEAYHKGRADEREAIWNGD